MQRKIQIVKVDGFEDDALLVKRGRRFISQYSIIPHDTTAADGARLHNRGPTKTRRIWIGLVFYPAFVMTIATTGGMKVKDLQGRLNEKKEVRRMEVR